MIKRFFDIIFSIVALFISIPLLAIICILIVLYDNDSPFFKQKRVGLHGNIFYLYKLRSMSKLADAEKGRFDLGRSDRITPIGKIIRKTKIDEIPQLFNVFIGDMSVVGPRPEIKRWVEEYPEKWRKILRVKPGITDPASIVFRNEEYLLKAANNPEDEYMYKILPYKLKLYEEYVEANSFKKDLIIIVETLKSVLFN